MANPILPENGTHQLQERYASTIVKLKRKENVVRNFFSRDYMGDPKAGAVKIPQRPLEVSVADYDVVAGIPLTTSTTTYVNVLVDGHKGVNELIDGYEAAAVPDNLIAQRLESGSYSLGRIQELSAISVLETNGTTESSTVATTTDNVYATILASIAEVQKLGISKSDIIVVINSDTELKLLTDVKYSNTASTVGAELVREGVVNRIGGCNVVLSDNLSAGTEYIVFARPWAATAEEWFVMPKINDLKNGKHIGSSALQGRMVYKDVLLDSTTCRIKTAE